VVFNAWPRLEIKLINHNYQLLIWLSNLSLQLPGAVRLMPQDRQALPETGRLLLP
jgi:hypothetical protein